MLVFPSPFPCSHGTMTILHTQSILSPWICPCITLCCPCWQQLMAMLLCSAMLPALLCLFAAVHRALLPALAVQYGYAMLCNQAVSRMCVCVGDFETLFRCINLQQPLCTMQCRLQLHCFIWRRNTRLQMCHQVCTMLLSAISVAGKPVHL